MIQIIVYWHTHVCGSFNYHDSVIFNLFVLRKFLFYLLKIVTQLMNPTTQVPLCGIHFLAQQKQDLTEGT